VFCQLFSALLVPDLRTANRAGDRLGMKSPVGGVLILLRAIGAECKTSHAGVGTVVRNAGHNRKTRTAIGAVDEGVAVAAVGWIKKLAVAIRADSKIG